MSLNCKDKSYVTKFFTKEICWEWINKKVNNLTPSIRIVLFTNKYITKDFFILNKLRWLRKWTSVCVVLCCIHWNWNTYKQVTISFISLVLNSLQVPPVSGVATRESYWRGEGGIIFFFILTKSHFQDIISFKIQNLECIELLFY